MTLSYARHLFATHGTDTPTCLSPFKHVHPSTTYRTLKERLLSIGWNESIAVFTERGYVPRWDIWHSMARRGAYGSSERVALQKKASNGDVVRVVDNAVHIVPSSAVRGDYFDDGHGMRHGYFGQVEI